MTPQKSLLFLLFFMDAHSFKDGIHAGIVTSLMSFLMTGLAANSNSAFAVFTLLHSAFLAFSLIMMCKEWPARWGHIAMFALAQGAAWYFSSAATPS